MQSDEEFPVDSQFVTEKRLREFGNEIKSNIGKRIDILSKKLDKINGVGTGLSPPSSRNRAKEMGLLAGLMQEGQIRCLLGPEENHISRNYPNKSAQGNERADINSQEN